MRLIRVSLSRTRGQRTLPRVACGALVACVAMSGGPSHLAAPAARHGQASSPPQSASPGARAADDPPPADLLRVLPVIPGDGPRITPYLTSQLDRAWQHDEARQTAFARLRTHADVVRFQHALRTRALRVIGGLPAERTPLRARVVGTIARDGYRIEKVVFESLPGLHVTALVYVPDAPGPKPAVLVACGHSPLAKAFVNYQQIAARLARRGFVVICWDPIGQGERSQFWDAAHGRSRYNLVCGEHAILGGLATLAGTSLTRWMVHDGMRVVDYLLTRPDVDGTRLAITGTSGGGFQSLWIGALDPRIAVVAPSAFVTALPTRMANRIFEDPDSDPEQDPFGLVSEQLDHAGLLLLAYPRAVHVSAAVKDFFPIEGTRKTLREVSAIYARLGHADRIVLKEGYHGHAYSEENQASAFAFIARALKVPPRPGVPTDLPLEAIETLEPAALQCTTSGQVRVDLPDGRSLVDVIRQDAETRKASTRVSLAGMYRQGAAARASSSTWTHLGQREWQGVQMDRYVLRQGTRVEIPLLHVHAPRPAATNATSSTSAARPPAAAAAARRRVLLSLGLHGHITPVDWPAVRARIAEGFDVVSFDLRGTGERRMPYRVAATLPEPVPADADAIYAHPLSSVLANYVYNAQLIGRPYLFDAIEDVDAASRFVEQHLGAVRTQIAVTGRGEADLLARAAAHVLGVERIASPDAVAIDWRTIVEDGREVWPIQYLMPGGAFIQLP